MDSADKNSIEIRGFLQLHSYLKKLHKKIPLYMELTEPISGAGLAEKLEIAPDEIEVIFVNGFVQDLEYLIHPGDRVAFLPPGCPGPYRIALGFYGKNQGNEANFKLKNRISS